MKQKIIIILSVALFLLVMPFVSPVKTQTNIINDGSGIEILYPTIDYVTQNQDFIFNFHTYNSSNGILLTNETVTCYFHLYNSTGGHPFAINDPLTIPFGDAFDFEVSVDKGNFSDLGDYSYIFHCNTSETGGFVAAPFGVIKGKMESLNKMRTLYKSIVYIVWVIIALIMIYIIYKFLMMGTKIGDPNV